MSWSDPLDEFITASAEIDIIFAMPVGDKEENFYESDIEKVKGMIEEYIRKIMPKVVSMTIKRVDIEADDGYHDLIGLYEGWENPEEEQQ